MTRKARIAQIKMMRLKLVQDIESVRKAMDRLEDAERKAAVKEKERESRAKEVKNEKK